MPKGLPRKGTVKKIGSGVDGTDTGYTWTRSHGPSRRPKKDLTFEEWAKTPSPKYSSSTREEARIIVGDKNLDKLDNKDIPMGVSIKSNGRLIRTVDQRKKTENAALKRQTAAIRAARRAKDKAAKEAIGPIRRKKL